MVESMTLLASMIFLLLVMAMGLQAQESPPALHAITIGGIGREGSMKPNPKDIPFGYCHCGCGAKTSLNDRNSTYHKLIKGQPKRFIVGHGGVGGRENVLLEYLENENKCWIWKGYIQPNGYGQLRVMEKIKYAHRVYYERAKGPIPDGLQIDHLCRVKTCVNPDHLEAVTSAVNHQRRIFSRKYIPLRTILKG